MIFYTQISKHMCTEVPQLSQPGSFIIAMRSSRPTFLIQWHHFIVSWTIHAKYFPKKFRTSTFGPQFFLYSKESLRVSCNLINSIFIYPVAKRSTNQSDTIKVSFIKIRKHEIKVSSGGSGVHIKLRWRGTARKRM